MATSYRRGIRLRVSRQRMEALEEICLEMKEEFKPQNDHQVLLHGYMQDLIEKLKAMLARNQELYTLAFAGVEAIAFYQLWQLLDISSDRYASLVVEGLLKKLQEC